MRFELEFCWIPLSALGTIEIYPTLTREKLLHLSDQIETFVYVENQTPD